MPTNRLRTRLNPQLASAYPPTITPMPVAINLFLQYLKVECGLARNTLMAYGRDLSTFASMFPERREPTTVTGEDIVEFLATLAERHLQPVTRARMLVTLRVFFRFCVGEGLAGQDPCTIADAPKLWKHLPHDLSPDEVEGLMNAEKGRTPQSLRNRAILEVFYATGARVSEVADIKLNDISLTEQTVRLHGKGNKERMVPIGKPAREAVGAYLSDVRPLLCRHRDERHLFLSRTGRRLDRENIFRIVKRAALMAGITKNVYPHLLRHSFATHMLEGGANLRVVQALLGHEDLATTEVYTHVHQKRAFAIYEEFHPRA